MADEAYGRQIPFAFLERIRDAFLEKFGEKGRTAGENSLNSSFRCVSVPQRLHLAMGQADLTLPICVREAAGCCPAWALYAVVHPLTWHIYLSSYWCGSAVVSCHGLTIPCCLATVLVFSSCQCKNHGLGINHSLPSRCRCNTPLAAWWSHKLGMLACCNIFRDLLLVCV